MKVSNADVIVTALAHHGVHTIFGVSGGFILPVFQATAGVDGCRIVATRNEQGASFMADAFARATGKAGCCVATSGPGATNLLTGVAASYADSVPMLVITGQVASTDFGRGGIQEGSGFNRSPSVQSMFRPVVKASYRMELGDDVKAVVEQALAFAEAGRPGPVHLEVPIDVMTAARILDSNARQIFTSEEPVLNAASLPSAEKAYRLISEAQYPLIIAGAGVVRAEADDLLRRVQDELGIPVVTSLGGKGAVDENDPLSLGMIGCYGQDAANEMVISHADVIIALGVSFQYLTSISWNSVFANKPLIHVDVDRRELGKNFKPTVGLQGSVWEFLEGMLTGVKADQARNDRVVAKLETLRKKHGFYPASRVRETGQSSGNYINPCAIGEILSDEMTSADDVVIDSGENAYWSMFSIRVQRSGQLFVNAGWGSMGYGAAAPVGVAAARNSTRARVFATCGDGGFLMNATEVSTAVSIDAPVTWIVMDNQGYGTQKHWQRDHYGAVYVGTDIPRTDFGLFAQSMGVQFFEARSPSDLRIAIAKSRQVHGPTLIWAHIDPAVKPPQALGSMLKK